MATILAGRGRLEDALLRQREAVKADPAASHQLQLAQLLFKAGRKAEARPVLVGLEKLGAQFERQDEVKSLLGQL
jgi:predicted Zn-dependent protease